MDITKMFSERGHPLIILENYKYRRFRELKSSGEVVWCCTNKKCCAKVYTLGDDSTFSRKSGVHIHEARNERIINRQKINNSIKRKAVDELCEKPSKLIHAEINQNSTTLKTISTEDVQYIRNNICYARLKKFPKRPTSIEETQELLNSIEIKMSRVENFLLVNDIVFHIIVFSCETNLQFMCQQEIFFVDGTFDYCAKYFLQMFTIHVYVNNVYVPVAFCLLKDKTVETYIKMFVMLKQKCEDMGYILKPKMMVMDFEKAIHTSVKTVFQNVEIVGCRFHLAQSWWRKIQNLGLSVEYKQETCIGKWLRHSFGLTFLSPHEVGDCFVEDLMPDKPEDERVDQFANYLVENYIDDESSFPPSIWAQQTASLSRTTNTCESFHSKFNNYSFSAHPNIYAFLNSLKSMQTDTYIRINSVTLNVVRKVRRDVIKKQNFIIAKIQQLESKNINRYNYIKCVSQKFCNVVL